MANKMIKTVVFGFLAFLLPSVANADIEAVSATIKGTVTNAQTEITKLQDMQKSLTDLNSSVQQGFNEVKNNVGQIVDVSSDPTGLTTTVVMQGVQSITDGSAGEDEAIENVKTTYNRQFGVENNITIAKELAAKINQMQGESAARLYARALVLRQELMDEENPDDDLETIEQALRASGAMILQSARRWNKILEMQAYINEYKNSLAIQNFVVEDGGTDNAE